MGDALLEAGFQANEMQARSDETFLLRKLIDAIRHFGRIPSNAELRLYGRTDPEFPSHNTFGPKADIIARLASWVAGKNEYADIAAILKNHSFRSEAEPKRGGTTEGLVYLIQSGAHYKIGRSNELERRVKEIRLALPETATLVHAIRTDDPPGIEAYWHRRFAAKRANGEWFKLSISDVAAFKRRKYQ